MRAPHALHVLASNDRRGAELFACALAEALEPIGWCSTVVSLSTSSAAATVPAVPLGDGRLSWRTLGELRNLAAEHDVVIAHGSTSLPACAVACAGVSPFVYRSIGDPSHWSSTFVKRRRTTWLLNRAHTVVTLFPEAGSVLDRWGVRSHLATIPNAVRCADFPPITPERRSRARSELALAIDAQVVLYLGAMSAEKRPERAVQLGELHPDWTILLVGEGALRSSLEARSEPLTNVAVHGPTSTPQQFLDAADVLVVPSDTEGVPAAAVEAGLSGLPVVASDVGGISQVIEHSRTGLLVPAGDISALADAVEIALERKDAIGTAARTRCRERFDITSVAGQWADVIGGAMRRAESPGQRWRGTSWRR